MEITAYIERCPETGLYAATVPSIPGAHTQGETLEELRLNLIEVVELCLEQMDSESRENMAEFIGTQQVRVAV